MQGTALQDITPGVEIDIVLKNDQSSGCLARGIVPQQGQGVILRIKLTKLYRS
ncbi:MAG: YwbE family protein [Deltaproteobacteria bacterium]|nr:YwbE family protein [Deltaproteobacteria bacterium]